jgi:hypothetical protein
MARRVAELQERQPAVAALAGEALSGTLSPDADEPLGSALQRLEAALRARVASDASKPQVEP